MSKPLASVSLDLDNLWSYLKIHGSNEWQSRPSYLDRFVPYMLDILERQKIKITFFIVGQDAAEPRNHAALRSLVTAGHEVGKRQHVVVERSILASLLDGRTGGKISGAVWGAIGVRVVSRPGSGGSVEIERAAGAGVVKGIDLRLSNFASKAHLMLADGVGQGIFQMTGNVVAS